MPVLFNTNYSGRKTDLLIHQGVDVDGEHQVALTLGDSGSVCTGVQKVAQQFTVMFLTEKGSRLRDPQFGTDFMRSLRAGHIKGENELQASFQVAVVSILSYLQSLSLNTPIDETLTDASMEWFDLRRGFLSIKVKITTAAGESRVVVLPVKVAIR